MTIHPLPPQLDGAPSPERFTNPFCYEPHPLCVAAADEVRRFLGTQTQWHDELRCGKMLGVLVVSRGGERGFLAAFSGTLGGQLCHPYFVPPVFDLMADGCYFQEEQARITALGAQIAALEARRAASPLRRRMAEEIDAFRQRMMHDREERHRLRATLPAEELASVEPMLTRQSQFQKAELKRLTKQWQARVEADEAGWPDVAGLRRERRDRSVALQQWLFRQYAFLDANGQEKSLLEMFHPFAPPSGAGDCCAPRLLQAAYQHGLKPLCMAEFWVGASPRDEVRHEGHYYPACHGRCRPILSHMLQGLDVEMAPLAPTNYPTSLPVLYQDGEMAIVEKPAGMLSVPGRGEGGSVQALVHQMFPHATGPMIVHRLDMDTSGLMVVALTEEAYHRLQDAFLHHRVQKLYHALLQRPMPVGEEGEICLPLRPDLMDRPRQLVDHEHGRKATSYYKVLDNIRGHALVELRPLTGRTHQLRVHCAHPDGLCNPILGDRLYGQQGERLMLHATALTIEGREFESSSFPQVLTLTTTTTE